MPDPSSLTRMSSRPPSSRKTSIADAPASIEFSTSSFTTDEGRSTPSPAAIWSATALGRIEISGIPPKLPILAARRSRDVFLLMLPLDVGLLVLGGVQNGLRLLWRHSRNRLRCGGLILTLRSGRTRSVALSSASSSASATTSSAAATAFLLAKSQLVVPARVGISDRHLENLLVAVERAVERDVGRVFRAASLDQVIETEVESSVMSNLGIL